MFRSRLEKKKISISMIAKRDEHRVLSHREFFSSDVSCRTRDNLLSIFHICGFRLWKKIFLCDTTAEAKKIQVRGVMDNKQTKRKSFLFENMMRFENIQLVLARKRAERG